MSDVDREIGRHDAQIEALRSDLARVALSMEKLEGQVQSVEHLLTEAKGGWRLLMLLGGAAGMLGLTLRDWVDTLFRQH